MSNSRTKEKDLLTLEFQAESLNKKITGEYVVYTPEDAKKFLSETKFKNRRLKRAAIQKYRSDMENNRWRPNGQPIIFDQDGNLMDGFHRMTALKEAKVEGLILYTLRGIDSKYVSTIDCGVARTIKDRVDLTENLKTALKYPYIASKAITVREGLVSGKTLSGTVSNDVFTTHSTSISDSEKLQIFKNELTEINWAIDLARRVKKNSTFKMNFLTEGTTAGLALYLLTEKKEDTEKINSFFGQLFDKEVSCETIRLLRRKLIGTIPVVEAMFHIRNAWNYFKDGKTGVKRLPTFKTTTC